MPLSLKKIGKIWYVHGSLNGIRVRESARTPKRDLAEAKLRQIQKDIEDRIYNSKRTLSEAITHYISLNGEKRFLMPILERFGNTPIAEMNAADVSNFALEHYGHMAPSSLKRQYYTPLNAVMRAAHAAEMAPLIVFKSPRFRTATPSYADMSWFNEFYESAHPQIAVFVLFISCTAARVTEACNLTLRDISFENGYATLRMTKNGKGRSIAIPPQLLGYISSWVSWENARRASVKSGPKPPPLSMDEPLFCYAARWSVNQAIERVCDKINVKHGALVIKREKINGKYVIVKTWLTDPVFPYKSSHKVGRHAFAARLLGEGKSLKFVAEAGGWNNIGIVSASYGHLERSAVDDRLRESTSDMLDKMGSHIKLHALEPRASKKLTDSGNDDELARAARQRISLISKDNSGGRDRD